MWFQIIKEMSNNIAQCPKEKCQACTESILVLNNALAQLKEDYEGNFEVIDNLRKERDELSKKESWS